MSTELFFKLQNDLSAAFRAGDLAHCEKLARQLRSQTTMPLAWIAARLRMGSRGYLAWLFQHGVTQPLKPRKVN